MMMNYLEGNTLSAMLSDVHSDLDRVREAIITQGKMAPDGDIGTPDSERSISNQAIIAQGMGSPPTDPLGAESHRIPSSPSSLCSVPMASQGDSPTGDISRSASSQASFGRGAWGADNEMLTTDLLRSAGTGCWYRCLTMYGRGRPRACTRALGKIRELHIPAWSGHLGTFRVDTDSRKALPYSGAWSLFCFERGARFSCHDGRDVPPRTSPLAWV